MDNARDAGTGLRERKKQRTRDALSWAALRLAVEHGLENVLVEDIAASAGVSPRTFNNYFSSKAEAICSRHFDRARQAAVMLRARPPAEPLWEAVVNAAVSQFGSQDKRPDPDWTAGVTLMMSSPTLQGEFLRASSAAESELAAAVAWRTGTDPDQDLYPQLVAAAVGAATGIAMRRWMRADPPVPLGSLLRDALQLIAAGLPDPTVV